MKLPFKKIMSDSLYRNSIYLMFSTGIMTVLGFVFWMIASRMYSTTDIGLATTIISAMGLIVGLSVLGLNIGLIRYLPRSKDKNKKINTCFTLTALASIIIGTIYLLGIEKFSPALLFIQENLILSFAFILFAVVSSVGTLMDSIFIAFRETKFILVKNLIFSILKIGGLFAFISLGAFGIFSSWMISLAIALGVLFIILIWKFEYKPNFAFYDSIVHKMGKYSFGNYIAGFIGGLPLMVLPLMITNMISPETTAYYYMAMMIAGLLFVIPGATTQSLFAEGSFAVGRGKELRTKSLERSGLRSDAELNALVWKAVKIISLIMIPAILVTVFFGDWILLAFGKEYAKEGFRFLQILAVSGVFVGVNGVFGMVFRVRKEIKKIILT
ncbi:oligosaccharide flippase family protein [Candidatus Pacearchaeota archaeon]|nr:oligosaccharide flippase family protein [Candidatus Pacearchaeota archaeon]